MKRIHFFILAAILFMISHEGYSQTRPSSTVSNGINGVCGLCQILNPDAAWDNDPASFTSMEISLLGAGITAEATYGFTNPVPLNNVIKLHLQFSGDEILNDIAASEIFQRLEIQLMDNSGTILTTYASGNIAQVDILSSTENIFEIKIINPDASTQRIKILTDELLAAGPIQRDLRIFDILHITNDIVPVTTAETKGSSGITLCINCEVENEEQATSAFDQNSDYALYKLPIALLSGYIYARYSWGGTEYSGNDYDIYLTMQNAQLLTLGSELLFFEDNNISVAVTYGDNSVEIFEFGNNLITADVLGGGSGRFFLKIDADNSKTIKKVEPRFGGNIASILNQLRLYTIFVTPTTNDPFQIDDAEATATVEAALNLDDYVNGQTLVTINDSDGALLNAVISAGAMPPGTQINPITGEITVSDASALQSGDFDISIGTTDILGGTTVIDVTISINPADQEAVYNINPAKPVNDYADDDILATVTDGDGNITAASVSSGSLPAGVTLETDGTLKVANATLLVANTYTFDVTTTDENGNTTVTTIELTFLPADQEATYTIAPPLPRNDYSNNDLLATVTDPDGAVTNATLNSGSLPAGTTLQSDGSVEVTNATLLQSGVFTSNITTTDANGGTTDHSVEITIHADDIEAIYTTNPPQEVSEYSDDDILATATDANGAIVAAAVSSGSLPAGVTLENDGTIKVTDASALVENTYTFDVTTTDENGGTTTSTLVLIFLPDDQEAVYTLEPAKPFDQYANGEVLASATDDDGLIVSASVVSGTLPAGTTLNSDGSVTVSDAGLLTAGVNVVVIRTEDENGGTTESTIGLVIDATGPVDVEAVYTVNPAKPIEEYVNGEIIATVSDNDGAITSSVVTAGALPAGMSLSANGTISVTDESQLAAGSTSILITTTDILGGTTLSNVTIVINPLDIEAIYTTNPPQKVSEYSDDDILATATDANGAIVAAAVSSGSLPAGVTLENDGTIKVTDASALVENTYTFDVTTTDENGGTTTSALVLIFLPDDQEAVYTLEPAKPFDQYANGEVLASATDDDGLIVSASVVSGTLPAGTTLNSDGSVTVSDAGLLTAGVNVVVIRTEDENGGTTESTIGLVIDSIGATDIEALYTVDTPKPVNDYVNGEVVATVSDNDGPITASAIVAGSLPAGMSLSANGTISVTDESQLSAGSNTLIIMTTDVAGGNTLSNITIEINPSDIEAVYTLEPSKPVSDYVTGEIIATVTDANGAIISATVDSGSLPAGVSINSDGTITVSDADLLVSGSVSVTVTTSDIINGLTDTILEIIFLPEDIESVYDIKPSKPVNDYANNDTLATVSDENGDIILAVISSGSLPSGTSIASDGTIVVSDETAILEGQYVIGITTTDENAGITTQDITIIIGADDIEAIYTIAPAKPSDEYMNDDVLATVTDENGDIIDAIVSSGSLPAGVELSSNGTITVNDSTQIAPGTYNFIVITTDEKGGTTEHSLTLQFNSEDQEAVYVVHPSKRQSEYNNQDTLATVTDADGSIIDAVVTQGELPPGTSLQPEGTITVSDSSALVAGSYTLTIATTDSAGGTTENIVVLTIDDNDQEAVYVVHPTIPGVDYQPGDTVASVTDPDGPIVDAQLTEGDLPPGLALQPDGTILIVNPDELIDQEVTVVVTTTDAEGGTSSTEITIRTLPSDIEAEYTLRPAKPVNVLITGDTLATVTDANGIITAAVVEGGALPPGTLLQPDGTIIVYSQTLLIEGIYYITVKTTDEVGGTTSHELEIRILPTDGSVTPPDFEVTPPKPSDQYEAGDTLVIIIDHDSIVVEVIVDERDLPPGTDIDGDGNIIVTNPEDLVPGDYYITIYYIDQYGGRGEAEVEVSIDEPLEQVDPLPGFSPDGDGVNDFWVIKDITDYPENVVKIFNRWGELVFTQEGYDNEARVWTGNANEGLLTGSGRLPQSTYFFLIDLKDGSKPLTGYIVLKY
uniref:Ig domain-containing protein n=1 Tax=Roseihalotalea indica TaxID=2867963 RepID=A0AA49JIR5_9BACT|nr:putative Ig domain-containing protein [Tunicatimonas sp. TK19036]